MPIWHGNPTQKLRKRHAHVHTVARKRKGNFSMTATVSEEVIRRSFTLCGITAEIDGSENDQMFSRVPRVLAEDVEQEEQDMEDEENDENESPENYVDGDDFDPFGDL